MRHVKGSVTKCKGVAHGVGNAFADIARHVRVGAEGDGYARTAEARKERATGVVVAHALAQARGRDLDAPTRIVGADGHLVHKRTKVAGGGKTLLAKALGEVRMGHHVKGERALAGTAPGARVAPPHLIGPEFQPEVKVVAIIDPTRARPGRSCGGHGEGHSCGGHDEGHSCGSGCGSSCGGGCGSRPAFTGRNVGKTCRAHYRGTFNDGTQFDSSYDRGEPLEFVCGAGQMILGFDKAVADMEVGQAVDVHLMPEEAYGMPDPSAVFSVEIAQLPGSEELEAGQQVYLSNQFGQPFPVKVVEKDEKMITFDANHEMAGKELNFRIELVEVLEG